MNEIIKIKASGRGIKFDHKVLSEGFSGITKGRKYYGIVCLRNKFIVRNYHRKIKNGHTYNDAIALCILKTFLENNKIQISRMAKYLKRS